ncbi:unnamed protein product [Rangifer tarandus platyrhynchus]|uniref:Uncharacterized protein n=2 Tax=Rangifer tarandus platyrhynchus TaxID=3082113 RepID=A0ACB0E5W2_RANTA|nr:unnamed protein product [Rangifer tarandus platyrhynchus]CAI9695915.1 unnamed protein product [Rangifer tarandus platyrhynchus]
MTGADQNLVPSLLESPYKETPFLLDYEKSECGTNHLLRVYYVHEVLALQWLEPDSGESTGGASGCGQASRLLILASIPVAEEETGGHRPRPECGCSEVSSGRGHTLPCTRQSGMACRATSDPDPWMPIRATSRKSSFSRVHIQEADSGAVLVHLDRLTRAKRSTTRNRQACC